MIWHLTLSAWICSAKLDPPMKASPMNPKAIIDALWWNDRFRSVLQGRGFGHRFYLWGAIFGCLGWGWWPEKKICSVLARHMANTLQEPSVKRTALKKHDWCTARCIQESLNVFCNAWWSWNYFLRTELTLFAKPVLVLAHVAECILLTQWQLLQRLQSFLAFCKGLDNLDKLCCSDDPSPARRPLACHCHIRVHRLQLLQKSGGLSIRDNPKRRPERWTNGTARRAECQRVAKCVKAWGDGGFRKLKRML